jgi:hypothetical protein
MRTFAVGLNRIGGQYGPLLIILDRQRARRATRRTSMTRVTGRSSDLSVTSLGPLPAALAGATH